MSEHFAFEQGAGNPAEIHLHERMVAAAAVDVDCLRHELLTRAVLTHDQHRRICRGNPLHRVEHIPNGRTVADYAGTIESLGIATAAA